jgi:sarcosine oxidase
VTDYRVVVLGLGGIGSAAVYWLSSSLGSEVLGLEQFPLGHDRGGSEDHSRIIRLSYHTPAYVELAKSAYAAWESVEVDSGEPLVLRTGGVDLAPPGAAIGLDDYRMSLEAAGVPFEMLDARRDRPSLAAVASGGGCDGPVPGAIRDWSWPHEPTTSIGGWRAGAAQP